MAPAVADAHLVLNYPIYASDFDPNNNGFLVVGGGGGESRSGVPNRIVSTSTSPIKSYSPHLLSRHW